MTPLMWGTAAVGDVTVTNDSSRIYVTYRTTAANTYVSDTRMYVTRNPKRIPRDRNGWGDPWQFDYIGEHEPVVTSYTYDIPFADYNFKSGEEVVIAAMAGVVRPVTRNLGGRWEWSVVWGQGERINANRKQEQFIRYTIKPCADQPPPPPPLPIGTGKVTITFDDGRESAFTIGFRVMQEFRIRGNLAVNSRPIDEQWATYMTLAQLQQMHAAGWSVVNHTVSHAQLDTVSAAVLESEIRDNKLWIEQHGFRGSNVFIVPFHAWGEREKAVVRRYSNAARGHSVTEFGPDSLAAYPPITDPYGLTGFEPEFAPFTTPEGRARTYQLAERAVREGKFLDLFFHEIQPGQEAAFREMMRMIEPLRASIQTYHDLFPAPVLAAN